MTWTFRRLFRDDLRTLDGDGPVMMVVVENMVILIEASLSYRCKEYNIACKNA